MAKRKLEIFLDINNEKEFNQVLNSCNDSLICAQIYCTYFGYCTALDHIFQKMKLDWSDGEAILLRSESCDSGEWGWSGLVEAGGGGPKVPGLVSACLAHLRRHGLHTLGLFRVSASKKRVAADEIIMLKRFWGLSEPTFLFILNKRVICIFKGVNSIRFEEVAKKEIEYSRDPLKYQSFERKTYEISESTPGEIEWFEARKAESETVKKGILAQKAARQELHKRHRAELMVPYVRHLNFVLYWPHRTYAHPELYERWDPHNIIMVAREEIQLTRQLAEDILYAGDAPINEASMHYLLAGPALAICFRLLDQDKDFVPLVQKILYEEVLTEEESGLTNTQGPPKTAFDRYKSYSLGKEEILQMRKEEKIKRLERARESRARRLSEMQRLARDAIEEAIQKKKAEREMKKLELLKSGNLTALENFEKRSLESGVDMTVPQELPDPDVEEESKEDDANEYFPPSGLLVPGFYAPPNEIAKVNGLAILFPKIVAEYVTPQPEFLPPHVLVLIDLTKRYKAIESLVKYKSAVLHMGIFKMTSPYCSKHIAYSVQQFDNLQITDTVEDMKLAFMLSVTNDLPLLELMDLNPCHVSRETEAGEGECAALFPVEYGDDYPEFEDFECYNDVTNEIKDVK